MVVESENILSHLVHEVLVSKDLAEFLGIKLLFGVNLERHLECIFEHGPTLRHNHDRDVGWHRLLIVLKVVGNFLTLN